MLGQYKSMDVKHKFLLHILISTFQLLVLVTWLLITYQAKNIDFLAVVLIIQLGIMQLAFFLINKKSFSTLIIATPKSNKNTMPGIKDILLIIISILGAALFAYFLLEFQVDSVFYSSIFVMVFIWLAHIYYAYIVNLRPNN